MGVRPNSCGEPENHLENGVGRRRQAERAYHTSNDEVIILE